MQPLSNTTYCFKVWFSTVLAGPVLAGCFINIPYITVQNNFSDFLYGFTYTFTGLIYLAPFLLPSLLPLCILSYLIKFQPGNNHKRKAIFILSGIVLILLANYFITSRLFPSTYENTLILISYLLPFLTTSILFKIFNQSLGPDAN